MKTKIIIFSIFLFVGTNRIYAQEKQVNTHKKNTNRLLGQVPVLQQGLDFLTDIFQKDMEFS